MFAEGCIWVSKVCVLQISRTFLTTLAVPRSTVFSALRLQFFFLVILIFAVRRGVRARFRGKFRRIRLRRRFIVRLGKRKYQIRGLTRGRCSIKVNRRPRPILRKRGKWFIRFGRRQYRVRRRGRRRYIRRGRKIIYLRWRFTIRFKSRRRSVICRRGRWRIKTSGKWRSIRRRRTRYIKLGRRRYSVIKRRGRYMMRRNKRWRRLRVRKRRRRHRRGKSRILKSSNRY